MVRLQAYFSFNIPQHCCQKLSFLAEFFDFFFLNREILLSKIWGISGKN